MPLDAHQRHHVEALLADSSDRSDTNYIDQATRNDVKRSADRLLDGTDDWPDPDLRPSEIHAWFESSEERDVLENKELPKRRGGG